MNRATYAIIQATSFVALLLTAHLSVASETEFVHGVVIEDYTVASDESAPQIELRGFQGRDDYLEIRFNPYGDAKVDPGKIRVGYGPFNLDVTNRIREHVEMSPQRISVNRAALPEGKHRITIEIVDSLRRKAKVKLRLKVAGPAT